RSAALTSMSEKIELTALGLQIGGIAMADHNEEREHPLGRRNPAVVDLRHDLVSEIQIFALDPGLFWRNQKSHEGRRSRRLARGLSKLGNLITCGCRTIPGTKWA